MLGKEALATRVLTDLVAHTILVTLKAEAGGLPSLRSAWAGEQIQSHPGHLSETPSQNKTNICCFVVITFGSKYFITDITIEGKPVCHNIIQVMRAKAHPFLFSLG